ncbi:MAG: hypothetical protein HY454_01045, partial [Parcubacteria group bacterium]|nr:hypothetical protein [Parcubacteria group bacterium]
YLILVLVAVVTSTAGIYIGSKIKEAEKPPQVIVQQPEPPSQYPDWDAIKGKNPDTKILSIRLTSDCQPDGCVNNKPATVEFDGIHKQYEVRGKFSRAYLYIEAVVDYKRPLTVWDDFYFKVNGLGGHLISDTNLLPVPSSEISRFLYDLRLISYFPSIRDKEKNTNQQVDINLFALLQNGITLDMTAAISSDRPGRIMKEVSIYYECFEGSDCSIKEKE